MVKKIGYVCHLRRLMADKDMYATTALRPLLAERGVTLSREQVYRLVTKTPERLSLATLAALCDILGCGPGELIEPGDGPAPEPAAGTAARTATPPGAGSGGRRPQVAVACCPAGHELASARRPFCPSCRRDTVVTRVAAVDGSLPREVIAAAVDAAAAGPAALSSLATAVASDPGALAAGAPPLVGRLVSDLQRSRQQVNSCLSKRLTISRGLLRDGRVVIPAGLDDRRQPGGRLPQRSGSMTANGGTRSSKLCAPPAERLSASACPTHGPPPDEPAPTRAGPQGCPGSTLRSGA